MKVRLIGLPREQDPEQQRQLWKGMELTVVHSESDPCEWGKDKYVWVDYEEVIDNLSQAGDEKYTDFFRRLRSSPGGSFAPGLLLEQNVCELVV